MTPEALTRQTWSYAKGRISLYSEGHLFASIRSLQIDITRRLLGAFIHEVERALKEFA